ncbi:XTP/dITP diphosphatase [Macrococcoides canis]|uniref:dITP/XTP pyrophosphatase n=1 Tax=Macrococcoides canis TaxID=1855823 RepID=A0A4R6C7L0_9STAP|nr:XTP/dITP diphosphatase [Macrococcus canis]MEE1107322.1 XTP/dITP diphosphatase [Macrococcus canis]TDM18516.1 XTP/dITP diphosphatase [Macrococcus canis]TDM21437.1 XTP/dITP diphosphatase [Macrococcus canis]TDM23689.1 XTP/dITP diphosphatase [Macrococcus canis]TDM31574.1 XTP/dITP diphosphatase [Macrococcus canis]
MKEIVIATGNKGKIEDFKHIFKSHNVLGIKELIKEFEVEETGTTFEANAALKSEHGCQLLNKIVISDDSGLEVDALNNAPGVYSARYSGEDATDESNIDLVLQQMESQNNRQARFVCVIAVSIPGQPTKTFRGEVEGELLTERRGDNGFGYDPIFYVPELGKTTAELTGEEKAQISHRGKAIAQLLDSQII